MTINGDGSLEYRKVLGVNQKGHLLVDFGEEGLVPFEMSIGPNGGVKAKRYVEQKDPKNPHNIDQLTPPRKTTRAERMAQVDQRI